MVYVAYRFNIFNRSAVSVA